MIMTLNRGVLTVVRCRAKSNPVLFPVSKLCLSVFHGQARGHATLKRLGPSASVSGADILFARAEHPCHRMRNFTSAGSFHCGLLTKAGSSGHGLLTKAGSSGHGLLTKAGSSGHGLLTKAGSSGHGLLTKAGSSGHGLLTKAGSSGHGLLTKAGSSGHGLLTKAGSSGHGLLTSRVEDAVGLQTLLYAPLGHPRCFHTTPQRYIPPLFWVLIKPVAKLGAILSGRTARKWWQAQSPKSRQQFWSLVRARWYYLALVAVALGGTGMLYYRSHIEKTPLTGRERFIAVTREQFMKIANAEAIGHLENYEDKMVPRNHPYLKRVQHVGNRLVRANADTLAQLGMEHKEWKCYVINDPKTINAFVLPTGHIFVFSGILDFARSDDQLAIILAHEMAHALLSHGIEQVSYIQLIDFLIITTMAAIWCVMPTDGISLITQWFYDKFIALMLHMPYSRMLEREADKVGLQLAAKACYDVREGSVFWARMYLNESITASNENIPEWLSTHPSHQKRVELFDFLVPKALEIREAANCPRLPARDPRDMIREMSMLVDEHATAKKTGQNLSKVIVKLPPGAAA